MDHVATSVVQAKKTQKVTGPSICNPLYFFQFFPFPMETQFVKIHYFPPLYRVRRWSAMPRCRSLPFFCTYPDNAFLCINLLIIIIKNEQLVDDDDVWMMESSLSFCHVARYLKNVVELSSIIDAAYHGKL
jgi:hypothetical protein